MHHIFRALVVFGVVLVCPSKAFADAALFPFVGGPILPAAGICLALAIFGFGLYLRKKAQRKEASASSDENDFERSLKAREKSVKTSNFLIVVAVLLTGIAIYWFTVIIPQERAAREEIWRDAMFREHATVDVLVCTKATSAGQVVSEENFRLDNVWKTGLKDGDHYVSQFEKGMKVTRNFAVGEKLREQDVK